MKKAKEITIDLLERIILLELREELARNLIANAYGGDWDQAPKDWKAAAERWRDVYSASLP